MAKLTKSQIKDMKKDLIKPFDENDIKYRIMQSGFSNDGKAWAKAIKYVDSRLVEERLDEVFGWDNWESSYQSVEYIDNKGIKKTGFKCTLRIEIDDKIISKQNGADQTEFEGFKGGISDSFKRTASHGLGIGRYLYSSKEIFVQTSLTKSAYYTEYAKDKKSNKIFYWAIPGKINNDKKNINNIEPKKEFTSNPGGSKTITSQTYNIVSDSQIKRLFTISSNTLYKNDDIKKYILDNFKLSSSKLLNSDQYNALCNYLNNIITKKDYDNLKSIASEKGVTEKDLHIFVEKGIGKKMYEITKKDYDNLKNRLSKKQIIKDNDLPVPPITINIATPEDINKASSEAKILFSK